MLPCLQRLFRVPKRLAQKLLPFRAEKYWEQRHSEFKGSCLAAGHLGLSETDNKANYRDKIGYIATTLMPYVPASEPHRRVLDIGCGTGNMFPAFQKAGLKIVGVDFSTTAIAEAKRRFPDAELIAGNVADVSGTFMLVSCIDVLFHVVNNDDWSSLLRESARKLTVDGHMIIQEHLVPAHQYEGAKHYCHFRRMVDYESIFSRVGLQLHKHESYHLPVENVAKDVLILKRRTDAPAPSAKEAGSRDR